MFAKMIEMKEQYFYIDFHSSFSNLQEFESGKWKIEIVYKQYRHKKK